MNKKIANSLNNKKVNNYKPKKLGACKIVGKAAFVGFFL